MCLLVTLSHGLFQAGGRAGIRLAPILPAADWERKGVVHHPFKVDGLAPTVGSWFNVEGLASLSCDLYTAGDLMGSLTQRLWRGRCRMQCLSYTLRSRLSGPYITMTSLGNLLMECLCSLVPVLQGLCHKHKNTTKDKRQLPCP